MTHEPTSYKHRHKVFGKEKTVRKDDDLATAGGQSPSQSRAPQESGSWGKKSSTAWWGRGRNLQQIQGPKGTRTPPGFYKQKESQVVPGSCTVKLLRQVRKAMSP